MIRITLKYGEKEKKILVPETQNVKASLKEADVDLSSNSCIFIGDRMLSGEELEQNFFDLGLADSSELTVRIISGPPWETKCANEFSQGAEIRKPKAQIIGCACIVFSAFTPDELRDIKRYMPEALIMYDEEGDPTFTITLDETSPGSLNEHGAVFSGRTTQDGKATITIVIDPKCKDPEKNVKDSLGPAILNLIEIEEYLLTHYNEVEERKTRLDSYISRT